MIILSEYQLQSKDSAGKTYLKKMEDAARLVGIEVINFNRGDFEGLAESLYFKRNQIKNQIAFWLGFVPKFEDYQRVAKILKEYNSQLINSPKAFSTSEFFDQFYPLISEETIESGIANNFKSALEITHKIGFPVFLKGTIQSLKKLGWQNCVAKNETELKSIVQQLKYHQDFSLGKIIVRKFVPLKHIEIAGNGIPKAHEYRFFVFQNQILDYSFYWNGENPFLLKKEDFENLKKTALRVAQKVQVAFFSADFGETAKGEWKLIEIGDGQFSDIRNISPLKFWNFIKNHQKTN